jgi:hypothetical protein
MQPDEFYWAPPAARCERGSSLLLRLVMLIDYRVGEVIYPLRCMLARFACADKATSTAYGQTRCVLFVRLTAYIA